MKNHNRSGLVWTNTDVHQLPKLCRSDQTTWQRPPTRGLNVAQMYGSRSILLRKDAKTSNYVTSMAKPDEN